MPKIKAEYGGWYIPEIGLVHGTETMVRAKALENPDINVMYAAVYLKFFQDTWERLIWK